MAKQDQNPVKATKESRRAPRARTLLRGVVYYDSRSVSVDCTVRDLSESGARITLDAMATVPDQVEISIPQKQRIFPATVRWRDGFELGVSFEEQRSGIPRRAGEDDVIARVEKIERELAAMRKLVQRLRDKVLPGDSTA
ncbi:MAG: PilZ domain-containing protein [Pseudolabrys sp.]